MSRSNINVLYFNVRSLLPKIDNLRSLCVFHSPDIICIVESWLDDTILDSEVSIQGYTHCRLDRSRHGGGVMIFVKNSFNFSLLFKGTQNYECLVVSVTCSLNVSPDFTIALFYRPSGSGHELLDYLFSTLCNIFLLSSSNFCLIGDFNIDFFVSNTPLYNKLLSVVSSFNLTQVVSEPTRVTATSSTLIDLIFVSSIIFVKSCTTIPPLANADHCGLKFVSSIGSSKNSTKAITRRVWRYSLADWDKAAEILDWIVLSGMLFYLTMSTCSGQPEKHYFLQTMEICIPHTMAEIKRNPPWITKAVLSAIKRRNTLFRTAKSTGKPIDRAKYNSKRNEVVNMLRECKQSFFNQQLNNVDTKTFWKTVHSLSQSSSSTIPMLQDGDKSVKSSLDKATTLNNFFYTCFNRTQLLLRDTSQEYLCPSNCPDVFLCTEDSVFELLTKLDTSKSTGSDRVSPRMLKCTASCIAPVLCKLFNLSISSGTLFLQSGS